MSIQVSRDRWGIAHIRADDEQSAFEAQGWVAAQDRFWQMDSDRLKAQGRWAEVVGPKGSVVLPAKPDSKVAKGTVHVGHNHIGFSATELIDASVPVTDLTVVPK